MRYVIIAMRSRDQHQNSAPDNMPGNSSLRDCHRRRKWASSYGTTCFAVNCPNYRGTSNISFFTFPKSDKIFISVFS